MDADTTRQALREHARPLDSPPTGERTTANDPVTLPPHRSRSFADASIVGLGEATHGTRECFEYKHGLVRSLVCECGVRTVAFEADAAAATALDTFVRDGSPLSTTPPDAASALAELGMWQWQTESVRDLLVWLREFNAGRAPSEQVRVRGVDLSTPSAPAAPLRSYFERAAPDAVGSEALRTVEEASVPDDPDERDRVLGGVSAAAAELGQRLERDREAREPSSPVEAWYAARQLCRVVEQACEWARVRHEQPGPHPAGMATRDRLMAENVLWALERDPGDGVAFWAHDGHVQRGTFDDGAIWADATTAGERLARELGDDYRPVGFDFGRGSFRAVDADVGELGTFTVGDPLDDSATAAFDRVGEGAFLLDVRGVAEDDRLGSWLSGDRRTRYVGSVFHPSGGEGESYARTDLSASFDWLLFLPESTPTRPVGDA